jgi:hypothetical protein
MCITFGNQNVSNKWDPFLSIWTILFQETGFRHSVPEPPVYAKGSESSRYVHFPQKQTIFQLPNNSRVCTTLTDWGRCLTCSGFLFHWLTGSSPPRSPNSFICPLLGFWSKIFLKLYQLCFKILCYSCLITWRNHSHQSVSSYHLWRRNFFIRKQWYKLFLRD